MKSGSLIVLEPSGPAQEFHFWELDFPGTLRTSAGIPLLGSSFSWNPQGLHRNSSSGCLIFLEPSGPAQEFHFWENSFSWNPQGLYRYSSSGCLIFLEPSGPAQEFHFWVPHFSGTLRVCTGIPFLGASFSWNPQGLHKNSSSGCLIFLEPSVPAQEFHFWVPHFPGTLMACTGLLLLGASFS